MVSAGSTVAMLGTVGVLVNDGDKVVVVVAEPTETGGAIVVVAEVAEATVEVVVGAWFTVATPNGTRAVTAYDLPVLGHRPVTGACLVGSVVEAAGGPAMVRSQLVQRTLDLVWHTLHEDPERPVRWCPGPRMRMMGLLELTSWNDAPERTQSQVVELLKDGQRTADVQRVMCQAEQATLVAVAPAGR